MTNGIDLTRLHNAEYLQFMEDYSTLINANNPEILKVQSQFAALNVKIGDLRTLFKMELASELTQEIYDLDNERDSAITGISLLIDAYKQHYDPAKREAATALGKTIALYGPSIAKLNYQAETATITSIISDWESEANLTAALNALGLTAWKEYLKQKNSTFNAKYLARTQEYGAAPADTLRAERNENNQLYYQLRDRIDAFAVLDPEDNDYTKTINESNALIKQYNALIDGRIPEKETPSEPTT